MNAFPETLPALLDCTPAEYHADPCPRPSFSSSLAKTLLTQSPYHAWLKHPKLGGVVGESTDDMDRGTLLHALILGTESPVAVVPFDDFRKEAAREARDLAKANGKIPVIERKYRELQAIADATLTAIHEAGMTFHGLTEQVIVWEEETTLGPVLCRCMIDHLILTDDRGLIYDLKTTECAHPESIARSVAKYGYDIQYAAYGSALYKLRPDLAGRGEFRWLFLEELPEGSPKRVALTVARPSGMTREYGRSRWKRACERWAKCLAENRWPLYADEPVHLDIPAWALKEELGHEYAETV